jgi:putative transposase
MAAMVRSRVQRLPDHRYEGCVAVAFTACLKSRDPYFTTQDVVDPHREVLAEETLRAGCVAYGYCFMPDHLHVVLLGIADHARPKDAFIRFKQRSGFLLGKNSAAWQKSFYDHVLRDTADTPRQVLYVLNNPVRAGLVSDPREYPFSGAIGMDLDLVYATVLNL